jgi:hypothetical protein
VDGADWRGVGMLNFFNNLWCEWSKNKTGKPKYSVCIDVHTHEDEFMTKWVYKWSEHFTYFKNGGCGCCVNIYEFDVPAEAVAELTESGLEDLEVVDYEESRRPIRTGTPSSFSEFNKKVESLKYKDSA